VGPECVGGGGPCDHDPGTGVGEDEFDVCGGIGRIDHHVRRPDLQRRKEPNHSLDRALDGDDHAVAMNHPRAGQTTGQAVRRVVQLAISQGLLLRFDRKLIRSALHPPLEDRDQIVRAGGPGAHRAVSSPTASGR
jgi:hypothetical protein